MNKKTIILLLSAVFILLASAPKAVADEETSGLSVGNTIEFGCYEQDNNPENGPEPVEWAVLDVHNNSALIISKYGLDMKQYNEEPYSVPWGRVIWEKSSIRQWLNNEFYYSCFSEQEIKKILKTEVINGFTKYSHIDGGNNTEDYVFLLSIDEAEQYFSNDKQRVCYVTPYGTAKGAWTEYDGACWWWLRSPGEPVEYAAHIFTDGDIHIYGNRLSGIGGAVRPALWITLE